jgi:signal transduction histidine kinase
VLDRLLAGESEVVGDLHPARGGSGTGAARMVAGVRRVGGGAIVLVADASAVEELQRPFSLDSLLRDIVERNDELAYVVLESGDLRLVHGIELAALPAASPAGAGAGAAVAGERELLVEGRPILDLPGPFTLESAGDAMLRLGMRLDGVRRATRSTLVRTAVSLSIVFVLTLVTLGFVALRRQYGELSVRHAAAEQALRRRDRLTAMGELASTVAHEVRNPLNAIAMASKRLRREFLATGAVRPADGREAPPDPELGELLDVLEGETQRINGIVQQFLEFARPPALVRRPVTLEPMARAAAEALQPLAASRGVSLVFEAAGSHEALVDPDQLRQVIDNLVRNAIDATPAGGRVSVSLRSGAREQVLEVSDTGHGIPADHLPKIFDLYFTTKAQGTGVGLAVAHQIVTAHGGTIEVESEPGAGTRMTVRLPRDGGGHQRG